MVRKRFTNRQFEKLVDKITETYRGDSGINFIDAANLPVRGQILHVLDLLVEVLFPGHTGNKAVTRGNVKYVVDSDNTHKYALTVDHGQRHGVVFLKDLDRRLPVFGNLQCGKLLVHQIGYFRFGIGEDQFLQSSFI